MPPLYLMIKPASGGCDMACGYCFYADEAKNRTQGSFGMMSEQVLETVLQRAMERARGGLTLAFQGGEPTLRGLDFYRRLLELEQHYNQRGLPIAHALQTNGLSLNEEWAEFLAQNSFLVGLSLDGMPRLHDLWRRDGAGRETARRVLQAAQLLQKHQVSFNLLTVVTAQLAAQARQVYEFYRRNQLLYQQYIPCLDPLGQERGQADYSLQPQQYGQFLVELFDLWYNDISHGRFVYIRYFDNIAAMLSGRAAENCGLRGSCAKQYVVEADGSVYPCDFYVLDEYRLGNLVEEDFDQLDRQREQLGFIQASRQQDQLCAKCQWHFICNGGCRRDREGGQGLGHNYFCQSYQMFFQHALPKYRQLLQAAPPPRQNKQK